MKRFTALILCFILTFSLAAQSLAVESQDKLTPAPEITGFTKNPDGRLIISVSHALDSAEDLRKMIFDIALGEYGSYEALMNSPEKYLSYKTKLYLEISADGEAQKTLKELGEGSIGITSGDLLPFADSGTAFIKIILASENFRDENTEKVYIYRESEKITLLINGSTVIPTDVPLIFTEELSEDMTLFTAVRKGYIFDGWSAGSEERIGKIPAGTKEITLSAHFIPMTYEINYVLTTDMNYPFGRADNSKNPVFYTVGEGVKLYDIKSPIGGYTFAGWYLSSDFSGAAVTEIGATETGDRLLYAKWLSDKEAEDNTVEKRLQYIKDNKLGDPDGDGKITASDARYVLRAAVGLETPDAEKLKRVDFYGSGRISADNARITLRIAVGIENLYDILLANGLLP